MSRPDTRLGQVVRVSQSRRLLADNGTPQNGEWYAFLNQWEQASVINENKGLFQSSEQIKRQYERGEMGMSGGLTWLWTQNVASHTTGPRGGAPLYATTVAGGSSITVTAFTASAANRLKKGDIFTIANVYAVNPVSRMNTGQLRQFTVTADVNSAADGTATIPIYPPIIGPATPSQSAPDRERAAHGSGAPDVLRDGQHGLSSEHCHAPPGVRYGHVPPQEPFSGQASYAVDEDTGVAISTWKACDISTDMHSSRADIAFGMAVPSPQWATRVWTKPVVM